jgi:hypothetical protein
MSFRGCLVKKSADLTAQDLTGGAAVTWDTDVYDTDALHDTGANTERITIPAGLNGTYGVLTAFLSFAAVGSPHHAGLLRIRKNAGAWIGSVLSSPCAANNGQASTAGWVQANTGAIPLATNDFFDIITQTVTDTSVTIKAESSFGLYVLDSFAGGYCLAKKSADQTGADYSTPAAIAWDGTDVYDTHAIHSPTSSNGKLIIPASLNGKYIVARANVLASSMAANQSASIAIRKNGSIVYDGVGAQSQRHALTPGWTDIAVHCQTQAIPVVTGDELEALYWNEDTSVDISAARSSFGLWVVG